MLKRVGGLLLSGWFLASCSSYSPYSNAPVFKPQAGLNDILLVPPENEENYAPKVINPVKIVAEEPVSTFSIDADTASYSNARRYLASGALPPAESIRVEEMINYFDYHYPVPSQAETPFNVHTEIAPTPWNPNTQLLRIGLQGYQVGMEALPPLNLVFLLDVSGSMDQPNKLPLLKRTFNLLVKQLRPQDHVAIVVYAGASGVVLEPTPGNKKAEIVSALNRLSAGGSTHGSAGLQLAYETAALHFQEKGINRVILGTDGDFNVGVTHQDDLTDLIERKRDSGVFLSILGLGTGNYNDYLMEDLSNIGNGNAYYIDSYQEARKVFAEDLTGTLFTIAKDVKVQIEFNPAQVAEYRLVGYENRLLNREDFNNDRVDAGEVGAGHSVTALYEIVPTGSEFRFSDPLRYGDKDSTPEPSGNELAFVKVRYKLPDEDQSHLMTHAVTTDQAANDMESASEAMRLAVAVAGFGERLRRNPLVDWPLENIQSLAQTTVNNDPFGYRHELVQLIQNANAIDME